MKNLEAADENFTLVTYIEEKIIMEDMRLVRNMFLLFVLLSASFFLVIAWYVNRSLHRPLKQIVNGMRAVEDGNYEISLSYDKDDEFGYVYRRFNKMVAHTKNLIQEVYLRKIQVQEMELARLQSHINPHFLYNSLYIGYRMAKAGETENVAKMCKYLGDYFRFITYFANNEVSVRDELGFANTYLSIQKLRHRDRLEFAVREAGENAEARIPVLLLQPVVENSIQYGMDGSGELLRVEVGVERHPDCIWLTVADNGPGMPEPDIAELYERLDCRERPQGHGYGLWNIYWRLRYAYGERGRLLIENRPSGGLSVRICIPADGGEAATTRKEEPANVQLADRG